MAEDVIWEEHGKWEFERDRSVLIVVDMQNGFVLEEPLYRQKEAMKQIPKIQKLIKKCRELGVPVIYTAHETDPVYCPLEVASVVRLRTDGLRRGTARYEIVNELAPEPDDIIIRKRRFSAFYQTDLDIILRNIRGTTNPVDSIIICGTVTNVCCEATARDAFYRDYKVVLGSDICSAHSPEAHKSTLVNMKLHGRSMDCEAIIKALENGRG